jgi:WD40 repeat protein
MSRDSFRGKSSVFLSYARKDGEEFATGLRKRLQTQEPEISLWQDRAEMEGGVGWWKQIEEALGQVRFLVIVMTPAAMQSEMTRKEWRYARQRGVNVYPVKGCPDVELDYVSLPNWMRKAHFFDLAREWETFVNYLKSDRQPARVPFMAPDLPEGFVQRPREFEQLVAELVQVKRETPIAITTALQGAGGYGKTTLAVALCHDDRVIGAFDDGILWVTLGQNPNILGELTKLYEALTGEQPDFVDETHGELKLREKLDNRNCLLVIDDVWHKARLEPFLQGGKQTCARLITTRRLDLVMDAKRVHVDEMTTEESLALLTAGLAGEPGLRDIQLLRSLASRLMDWPLLLKLAAGVIRARVERGDTLGGALEYANRAYERRGLSAFDSKDAVKRNDAVAKSIDTAKRLADFTLIDLDLRAGSLRLHDEIRLHLVHMISDEAALHARLVDRLGDFKEIRDPYALRRLPWHLGKAGRDAARRALLVDFNWMMAKLNGTDIQSLIADYESLPEDPNSRAVRAALLLSAHILASNPRELPGQLIGRLPERLTEDIDSLRSQASKQKGFSWLRPLKPSLTPLDPSLIRTLQGHINSVTGLAVTPDGHHLVSGSQDKTLRVWDLATGESKRTMQGHAAGVTSVAVTRDGRQAVSGSHDKTLRVWDLATGQLKRAFQGHNDSVTAVAVTPDGQRVVSSSYDRTIRVWDLAMGESIRTLQGHTASVTAVAVTPDGRQIVSGSRDRTLRVWDLATGRIKTALQDHTDSVTAVAVTPDGHHVVSGSYDRTARVWDLATGEIIGTLRGHASGVSGVAVTPDNRHVISGSHDRTLCVWDLATGESKRTLQGHNSGVTAVAVTPNGRHVISGSWDKTLRVWDLLRGGTKSPLASHASLVTVLAVTPDGRRAVSGSNDKTLRVWDSATGESETTLQGHTSWVNSLAVTPDGRHAVSASDDKTLRLWDFGDGQNQGDVPGSYRFGHHSGSHAR